MKCPNCDSRMVRRAHEHKTRIGAVTVKDASKTAMTSTACGTVSLAQVELAGYERRAAALVLAAAERVGGDVVKFARKSLGLLQKDFAALLDSSEQQVSQWEHEPEVDRLLRFAVLGLLRLAETGEDRL
jgi:DNA-binding transcriptional regulator YiaG